MSELIPGRHKEAEVAGLDVAAAYALARSGGRSDRETLLLSLADVCRANAACAEPEVRLILRDIFLALIADAEKTIRAQLANTLADVAWAPDALIKVLAREDICIARPILARSPVLDDGELIKLLLECSIEHQVEIARRPGLAPAVATAIIAKAAPPALVALAENATAGLSDDDLAGLVGMSQSIPALRPPLTDHARLTPELAAVLYGWVGETLRRALTERFPDAALSLKEAVKATVNEVRTALDVPGFANDEAADRTAMEQRQVKKLELSGQLRPGFLVRALNEGRLSLFIIATSALAGVSTDDLRSAMNADQILPFQVVCTLAGIDKTAFPTVLRLVQSLNGGLPTERAPADRHAEPVKTAPQTRAYVWS